MTAPVGYALGVLRIAMGWTFLWPFLDKLFGLGFATCRAETGGGIDVMCDAAFLKGGSPTYGFLTFGTEGSHTGGLFDWMASSGPTDQNLTDWLFMGALLGAGVLLTLGIMMRIACVGAAALLVFMYLAGSVWPENNPFLDDHLVEAIVLIVLMLAGAGRWLGLGTWWEGRARVQRTPLLK